MVRKVILLFIFLLLAAYAYAGGGGNDPQQTAVNFPPSFASYHDADIEGVGAILKHRISHTPFNLVASLIFLAAIIHTFLSSKFLYYAHKWKAEYQKEIEAGRKSEDSTHLLSEIFHFLGEVEVIFGLWAVALCAAVVFFYDWHTFVNYVSGVNYTEPMFVVVIMALASSRPIVKLSENVMSRIAAVFKGTLAAWWLTIMTLGPILGSFITEPAAMTISAMLALTVDDDELTARLLNRAKTSGRADDANPEIIANRIAVYKRETAPVAGYFEAQGKLIEIDGLGSIDEISERLFAAIDSNGK